MTGAFSWQLASPSSIIVLSPVSMQFGVWDESPDDSIITFWGWNSDSILGRFPFCFPVGGKLPICQILGQIKVIKNEFLNSMWANVHHFTLHHYFPKEQPVFLNNCFPWQLLAHYQCHGSPKLGWENSKPLFPNYPLKQHTQSLATSAFLSLP